MIGECIGSLTCRVGVCELVLNLQKGGSDIVDAILNVRVRTCV